MLPEQQQRILGYFIEEAKEHLTTIEQGLLNLQSTIKDPEILNEIFRAAHSIKGGAAMLGLSSIQHTAHRLEDCFKVLKEHPVQVDQKLESLFLGVSDTLKALLENLQGPFGLTDETANNLMSEAEPVFGWLNEHLDLLVKQGSGATTPIHSDRWQNCQNQVLQKLREMLQLFKQPATPETRQNLQDCCSELAQLGEELNCAPWCKLCQATGKAIANEQNSYLTLAKIVITDIRQALELVLTNREAEITISQQLEALIPPEIELLDITTGLIDESAEQEEFSTAPEENIFSASFDTGNQDETIPQTTNNFAALTVEPQPIDFEVENSITSLSELSEPISNATDNFGDITAESEPIDSIANLSELSEELISDDEDETLILKNFDPNGPEVGIAELSTLAQLFENETPELNETWDIEEEILEPVSSNNETEIESISSTVEDVSSDDFAELLSLEGDYNIIDNQVTTTKEELTLVQLFGDVFLEEENLEQQNKQTTPNLDLTITPTLNNSQELSSNSEKNLDDLFAETEHQDLLEETALEVTQQQKEENWTLDNLFAETEEDNSPTVIIDEPEFGDLFDLPLIAEFSPAENLNLWVQGKNENQETELQTTVEQDAAKALEEILLTVATADNIFDENTQIQISTTADFELEDLNLNLDFPHEEQQLDLILLADPDDLFAELAETDSGISSSSVGDREFHPAEAKHEDFLLWLEQPFAGDTSSSHPELDLENHELSTKEASGFSQSPEELELAPEFTDSPTEILPSDLPQIFSGLEIKETNWLDSVKDKNETLEILFEDLPVVNTNDFQFDSTDNPFALSPQGLSENILPTNTSQDITNTAEPKVEELEAKTSLVNPFELVETTLSEIAKENNTSEVNLDKDSLTTTIFQTEEGRQKQDDTATVAEEKTEDIPTKLLSVTPEIENISDTPTELTAVTPEEKTSLESNNQEDAFASLYDLLQEEVVPETHATTIQEIEFAALEELLSLDDENLAATNQTPTDLTKTANNSISSPEIENGFKELEGMVGGVVTPGTIGLTGGRNSGWNASRFEQLMKVPVKHLDDLSNLVGELVVNRNTLEQDQERLRQSLDNLLHQVQQLSDVGARMQELYERSLLEASLLASRKNNNNSPSLDMDRGFSELEMDRFTPFHSLSQEMIELIVRVRESASDIDFVTEETERVARQFRQVTTQLQEGLTRSRMEPFSQATDLLPRGVRDNSIKYGKQVELVIQGRDTLIDKMILEHLKTPLTHLLNNAIAHGIETPEERQAKGKAPVGTITVCAFHQGNQTVISVSDNGAGIDTEGVKAKAIKVGLITPAQAKNLSPIDIYDLLFQPGFTTKDQADDLAGRGVGLDVVKTKISEIRGTITIDSALGRGTTFTIRLPLTLSICKALCCVSDKARIAFPMDGVEDTLDIPVKNIQQGADGEKFITWRDRTLPFKPLKELLTFNRQLSRGNVYGGNRDDDMISVVVVRSTSTLVALQIDQVLSEQEIVIKQFEGPAPKPVGVAGATVLGDGRIMPIADVLEIIDIFQGRTSKQSAVSILNQKAGANVPEAPAPKIDPTVLIVDDSITVRELLSLTFNKAGYRVEQARDGQEAWDKLRSGLPCDLVFCDIEMPRCDGLELLSRIQKDPNLNHLPIAMLTSRGADKHRQMAVSLGASGYFTKPYLEEALLEAASRMLKGEKLVNSSSNG